MKITVPSEETGNPKAAIYGHFGSAPCFVFYDSDTKTYSYLDNSNQEHTHGQCQPTALLKDKKIEAVICGGMGARAVNILNQLGIRVYRIEKPVSIESGIEELLRGDLEELSLDGACSHHDCH